MKYIYICLIIVSMLGCKRNLNGRHVANYNIKIDYLGRPYGDSREMIDDSLHILFDGNFQNDTVQIHINNSLFKELVLKTDEVVGIADHIKTIKYSDIRDIGIRINNGKIILIEPEARHYNIRLTYLENLATVRFYRRFPGFM